MTPSQTALYFGTVVHKRIRPVTHSLRYKVFAVLFDCNELHALSRKHWLFSYNRFNLFSLHDRDHGDGSPLNDYLDDIANRSGCGERITRFQMFCYPRILGYVFNPVTVYFGIDENDNIQLVVYEVNNTFGERMTYVIPAKPDQNGLIAQSCDKQLYVSPFNDTTGTYEFHVTPLQDDFTLGIALKDETGPVIKAYFRGQRTEFDNRNLLRALQRTGWMTVKVMAGIYVEAAKLWIKGLRPVSRPSPPKSAIAYIDLSDEST